MNLLVSCVGSRKQACRLNREAPEANNETPEPLFASDDNPKTLTASMFNEPATVILPPFFLCRMRFEIDATCPESLEIVSDVQGDVSVCT
jgi:hypothetical protein